MPPQTQESSNTTPTQAATSYFFRDQPLIITRGSPLRLGANSTPNGVNFALISRHATQVQLVLLQPCSLEIQAEIPLDSIEHRTGDHWHVRVAGLPEEFSYGYRVDGPKAIGNRFDPSLILLDPASRALSCGCHWGLTGTLPRHSLMNRRMEDHPGGVNPHIPREDSIIYELHVRGYTVDPSSGVKRRGTYSGLIEKVPYLKSLGVTAVEILPIDEFDENDCPFYNPFTGQRLKNYWGYNTIAFGAPKAAYAGNPERAAPLQEFQAMVRGFHDARIEVVLDVVFNHTSEGGDNGPTLCFRGIDNSLYYMLDDHGHNMNFSGCGNTIQSNHPVVRDMILSCLRNLVSEADVDGFRFDLASVFGRDRDGNVIAQPPVIEQISEDSLLTDTKLIAEPWDAAGLNQVDSFPGGERWSVWNGRYRDDVRKFWRGDPGMTSDLATRLCGSDDLCQTRGPLHSINFITCHDGFTLADLVSYNTKHNEMNGEGNRDGASDNCSWNCGVEGPTDRPEVLTMRGRQARNLLATLLISQGVPMILGGDEFLRTQHGNNNAWCQDNEVSWVDWSLTEKNADFLRFTRMMIALRLRHPALRRKTFLNNLGTGSPPDILWHGVEPCAPDFSELSHSLAFTLDGRGCDRPGIIDRDLFVALNAFYEPLTFQIPAAPSGRRWRRTVDTALPSPEDIAELDAGPPVPIPSEYRVESRSMIILVSESE